MFAGIVTLFGAPSAVRLRTVKALNCVEWLLPGSRGVPKSNAKLKEKQKWSHEKPHLDTARKLRGIYFIDPEDKEFKETIKNARRHLEIPVAPAMPCKILQNNKNCGSGASNKVKTKLACILEANESTRTRMEESLPKYDEDHIAGKGYNSLQHYNLVHKFIPIPQAIKSPQQKQRWTRNGKNWRKFRRGT